jgi:hypothetical protein
LKPWTVVEQVSALLLLAIIGVVRGRTVVGGEGDEPVIVGLVAAHDGQVAGVKIRYRREILTDRLVEDYPFSARV